MNSVMFRNWRGAKNVRKNYVILRSLSRSGCLQQKHSSGGPLAGVRVLDMTRILAGPFCTMLLGDLGAEIIKIENPEGGDESRNWGPPFVNGESAYFLSINRNKKSIAIDLKSSMGRAIVKELATKSDILVENYIPGKLSSFGLDYETLKVTLPHLIYCSITGYGSTGPYSNRAGYDTIAASIGGLNDITGPEDGEPCKTGVAMTDLTTGLYAHGAIMAALLEKSKTGVGQKIECNLLSSQVSILTNVGLNYLNGGKEAKRWGTAHESIVPYQAFKTKNGYITIGGGTNKQFKTLCELLKVPHLVEDPLFKTNKDRVTNRKLLIEKFSQIFSELKTEHWLEVLEGSGMPYGPVNNMQRVFSDPQVIHNNMIVNMEHPVAGAIKLLGPAVKFSNSCNTPRSPPPAFAQHCDQVLSEILCYTQEEIDNLRKMKIIV